MITLYVELSCDQPDCTVAYDPAVTESTDVRATRTGAQGYGWTRRDGQDYCPDHSLTSDEAALVATVSGLAAQGRTDSAIAEGLGWTRRQVQLFRGRHGIAAGVAPGRPIGSRTRRRAAA